MIPRVLQGNNGSAANQSDGDIANYLADLNSSGQAILANIWTIADADVIISRTPLANGVRHHAAAMSSTWLKCREVVRSAPRAATSRLTSKEA